MKNQTRTLITMTIIFIIIFSCFSFTSVFAEEHSHDEFFPRLTIVINNEQIENTDLWIVFCQDKEGNIWSFFSDNDNWVRGDIANLLMCYVDGQEEDEVIEVYWEGYSEDIETFFSLEEWR